MGATHQRLNQHCFLELVDRQRKGLQTHPYTGNHRDPSKSSNRLRQKEENSVHSLLSKNKNFKINNLQDSQTNKQNKETNKIPKEFTKTAKLL
jgi:hypothetical protein